MRLRQRGMSLVEVLVAVAIGLIGILIITQAYLTSDNFNRSTLGEGGAQTNGTIAVFTIERDLRMAGYALNDSRALNCGTLDWYYNGVYSTSMGGTLPDLSLAPAAITLTAGSPDQITVMYGTGADRTVPGSLTSTMATPGESPKTDGIGGYNRYDLMLLVNQSVPAHCTIEQLSAPPVPADSSLPHDAAANAPYNPAGGGIFPTFAKDDLIFDLGTTLTARTYRIVNNKLNMVDPVQVAAGTMTNAGLDLVDGIVDLRAQYGMDDGANNGTVSASTFVANDGIVDNYTSATPANWSQVLAVRIAVLARIGNYEKPTGGVCTATTALPTWQGSSLPTIQPSPFALPEGLPSCYRYRVFETIVPLRNMIWRAA
jgi:type IV pilus assembly protein PilW